jgi:nitrite reductase/ring-hydroxylating ferredoxin subunit
MKARLHRQMATDKHLLGKPLRPDGMCMDLTALPGGPPAGHLLADLSGLPADKAVTLKIPYGGDRRISVFVQRLASREVVAYVNACPHIGVELDLTPGRFLDRSGRHFICAMHGALFEPDTGLCTDGPCKGQHLRAIAIQVAGDKVFTRTAKAT